MAEGPEQLLGAAQTEELFAVRRGRDLGRRRSIGGVGDDRGQHQGDSNGKFFHWQPFEDARGFGQLVETGSGDSTKAESRIGKRLRSVTRWRLRSSHDTAPRRP